MRLLFTIDKKDYNILGTTFSRPSARGIIIKNHLLAMVHSLKRDYYKFPGGGIKTNEPQTEALVREVLEETGLIVLPASIQEYGYVHQIQKGSREDIFIQDNYYYFCKCAEQISHQALEDYESDDLFTLEFVDPQVILKTNRDNPYPELQIMLERENRVIELLIQEHKI